VGGGVGSSGTGGGAPGGFPGIGGGGSGGTGRSEELGGGLGGGAGGGFGGGSSGMLGGAAGLNVSADETNNALVVVGTTRQYELVEAALRRLDVMPVQVVIEAAVAEVTLSDDLRFGLQWAFRSGDFAGILNQTSANPFGNVTTPGVDGRLSRGLLDLALPLPAVPGFSFLYSAPNVTVVLNALDRITKVNVLSSPHLMVLNNQTAALQVGNQVPITVGTAQSTLVSGGPIVSQLQYKDTGIILQVTPRVNDSGTVLLDIAQEVSAVIDTPSTTTSQIQSPTFLQRRLVSSVSVQDGQTIALGGLIRDSNDNSRGGIPVLSQVPVLGWLFGSTVKATGRTELLVLLTPRVVRGQNDAQLATDELRNRMRLLRPIIVNAKGGDTHQSPSR
jgi:general secretion pathway protein D